MADIALKQTLNLLVGKTPTNSNQPVAEKDFELQNDISTVTNVNEDCHGRFVIPVTTVDLALGMGTVSNGTVFLIKPETDIKVKLTNSEGTSQIVTFLGGRTSILHCEFTGISVTNDTSLPIKGIYLVVGD